MEFRKLFEDEILDYLPEIAALRISIFREFPYLYEGSMEYEEKYLSRYARGAGSFIGLAVHSGKVVGAASCLPLSSESEQIRKAYRRTHLREEGTFYFGESLLLPEYRGRGIGHDFFNLRESHARDYNAHLEHTSFCAVVRPPDHPLRPENYRPLDSFWSKRGYRPLQGKFVEMAWTDRGDTEETTRQLLI